MATISLRVPDEELAMFKSYASLNHASLSEMIRQTVLERIEDEYDLKIAREALEDYARSGYKSRPIEELWEELGL